VFGKGWTSAKDLEPGDELRSHDGHRIFVERVHDTGETVPVYNLRIAEYHTYFVGSPEWEFSVWAHNACNPNLIGRIGELVSAESLIARGWKQIASLQRGRNGIDLMFQKVLRNGVTRTLIAEVKANGARLSRLQRMGADAYARNVLGRLRNGLSPGAKNARDILQQMIRNGEPIRGVIIRQMWDKGKYIEQIQRWVRT